MSWYQLLEFAEANREWRRSEFSQPPKSCPNDGTPLTPGPDGEAILFCPHDGWQYPRDDHRPSE